MGIRGAALVPTWIPPLLRLGGLPLTPHTLLVGLNPISWAVPLPLLARRVGVAGVALAGTLFSAVSVVAMRGWNRVS